MQGNVSYQYKVILENNQQYYITLETYIENDKYWYLMNLENNDDILIAKVNDQEIEIIDQPEELSKIINKIAKEMKVFFD